MTLANWQLENWTTGTIATECRTAYAAFAADVRRRHIAYYDTRADQRSKNTQRPFEAADLRFAFPPGWEALAETPIAWHRHARSAASSQTLLLSLLAPAIDADPTLSWLKDLSGWLRPPGNVKSMEFEHTLESTVLDESPRQTSLDWFLSGTETLLAAEAKFTEKGFEPCSCPSEGSCTDVILGRKYWAAAAQLGWDHRHTGGPCLVRTAYQPIRNLAAAMTLAPPGVLPCFALFYDERNPYFAGAGNWPGWARIIDSASQRAADEIVFAPVSWQRLLACAPLHDSVVAWAEEKHGLRAEDRYIQPQMCGYDGDGDIWIELSDRVPNEAAALDAAARLDGGADEWSVVGRDSLSRECDEWVGCDPEAPDAKLFWHVQWVDGPVEA